MKNSIMKFYLEQKGYCKNDQIWSKLSKLIIEMIESSNFILLDIEGILIINLHS